MSEQGESSGSAKSSSSSKSSGSNSPRQNYHKDCEAGINKQINLELHAMYTYLSMAYHYDRYDVALPGFSKYFRKASKAESKHARKLMKYQDMRGGHIVLEDIKKPDREDWGSGLDGMRAALALEKAVNQNLLDLHELASKHHDGQMADFLGGKYLQEQVKDIKKLSSYVTELEKAGPGLGEHVIDQELYQKIKQKKADKKNKYK